MKVKHSNLCAVFLKVLVGIVALGLTCACANAAEVIFLKNGTRVMAEKVTVEGDFLVTYKPKQAFKRAGADAQGNPLPLGPGDLVVSGRYHWKDLRDDFIEKHFPTKWGELLRMREEEKQKQIERERELQRLLELEKERAKREQEEATKAKAAEKPPEERPKEVDKSKPMLVAVSDKNANISIRFFRGGPEIIKDTSVDPPREIKGDNLLFEGRIANISSKTLYNVKATLKSDDLQREAEVATTLPDEQGDGSGTARFRFRWPPSADAESGNVFLTITFYQQPPDVKGRLSTRCTFQVQKLGEGEYTLIPKN